MMSMEILGFRDVPENDGDCVSTDNAVAPYFSFGLDKARGAKASDRALEAVFSVETFLYAFFDCGRCSISDSIGNEVGNVS